jgi:hypothetical protein
MDTELGIGVDHLALCREPKPSAEFDTELLGGITVINGRARARLFEDREPLDISVRAIPYFAQNNRSAGTVHVWTNS